MISTRVARCSTALYDIDVVMYIHAYVTTSKKLKPAYINLNPGSIKHQKGSNFLKRKFFFIIYHMELNDKKIYTPRNLISLSA